jgi:uncharacterized protein YkwD
MKNLFVFTIIFGLLVSCEVPRKKPEVINQNQFLVCESAGAIRKNMVRLINDVRKERHRCGNRTFSPAGRVHWNSKLGIAALNHARDLAQKGRLSHTGSDGSEVQVRVQKAGYRWRAVDENLSAGHQSSEEVVAAWLDSPGHCTNLMDPIVTEIGAACFRNPDSTYGTYWTLLMAAPRK